jgi:hypothetical protein
MDPATAVGFANSDDIPWADVWPGVELKVLRVVAGPRALAYSLMVCESRGLPPPPVLTK